MSRPRHLPNLSPNTGWGYLPTSLRYAGFDPFTERATQAWYHQLTDLTQPSTIQPLNTANQNEPTTVAAVLDLLLRLEPENRGWTAAELAIVLNREYYGLLWNATKVGRIMGAIYEAQDDCPGLPEERPIVRGNTGGTATYRLVASPRNWVWLGRVRQAMGEAAERRTAETYRIRQVAPATGEFPWDPFTQPWS